MDKHSYHSLSTRKQAPLFDNKEINQSRPTCSSFVTQTICVSVQLAMDAHGNRDWPDETKTRLAAPPVPKKRPAASNNSNHQGDDQPTNDRREGRQQWDWEKVV